MQYNGIIKTIIVHVALKTLSLNLAISPLFFDKIFILTCCMIGKYVLSTTKNNFKMLIKKENLSSG